MLDLLLEPAGPARALLHLHQPRHRRDPLHLRPRRGDVPRRWSRPAAPTRSPATRSTTTPRRCCRRSRIPTRAAAAFMGVSGIPGRSPQRRPVARIGAKPDARSEGVSVMRGTLQRRKRHSGEVGAKRREGDFHGSLLHETKRPSPFDRLRNHLLAPRAVAHHVIVPKPEDFELLRLKPLRPRNIARRVQLLRCVVRRQPRWQVFHGATRSRLHKVQPALGDETEYRHRETAAAAAASCARHRSDRSASVWPSSVFADRSWCEAFRNNSNGVRGEFPPGAARRPPPQGPTRGRYCGADGTRTFATPIGSNIRLARAGAVVPAAWHRTHS